jgi:hypothetical protein
MTVAKANTKTEDTPLCGQQSNGMALWWGLYIRLGIKMSFPVGNLESGRTAQLVLKKSRRIQLVLMIFQESRRRTPRRLQSRPLQLLRIADCNGVGTLGVELLQ